MTTNIKLELVYLPEGKYWVYPRMVYMLAIVMPPPPDNVCSQLRVLYSSKGYLQGRIQGGGAGARAFQKV